MKILPLNEANAHWNQLVDQSPEAWLFHRSEWVELETCLYQNESFVIVSDDGRPLGVFCVYLSPEAKPFRKRYFFTGHGRSGPAMAPELSESQRRMVMTHALDYLRKRSRVCNVDCLEVRLPSLAPAYLPPLRRVENPLWEFGFGCLPRYGSTNGLERLVGVNTPTTIIELQNSSEEDLFAACSHACRNVVRKAMRAGVTCIEDNTTVGLNSFYATYQASFERSGAQVRPLAFFQKMHASLAARGLMKLFVALYEGKPVASVLLLCYKDAVTYYAGGLDYNVHRLSPHNLLIWETLKWARREGKKWFEVGPYFPYLSMSDKMRRIGDFKREFGGSSFLLLEGLLVLDWSQFLAGLLLEELRKRVSTLRQQLRMHRGDEE